MLYQTCISLNRGHCFLCCLCAAFENPSFSWIWVLLLVGCSHFQPFPQTAPFSLLCMQFLPSFYEGPIRTRNVTIRHNRFEVGRAQTAMVDVLELGPSCCETQGLVLDNNTLMPISDRDN